MNKRSLNPNLNLKLSLPPPDEISFAKFLTQSGTFMDGDLLVNRDGVRIVTQTEPDAPPPIQPADNQMSLEDIDTVKVIGKGNGGIVQLVQHKWTGQFFALKLGIIRRKSGLSGLVVVCHHHHLSYTFDQGCHCYAIVKVHGVFPSSLWYSASSRRIQFHRVHVGDSGAFVTPFMRVATHATRNFATLGQLTVTAAVKRGFHSELITLLRPTCRPVINSSIPLPVSSFCVIQMNIQESARRAIAQELKINQSAQCPNVVMCYQSFYDNGAVSIILEYMDGGSLADFLRKVRTIPEPYLAAICKQVLKGLLYLHHEKHVIHRDMKPSNLLINHRGEVKITDFGVSAIMQNTSGQANTFVGTYNYMSPERISGEQYGYKSDIWSLGLVLMECATGHFPYSPPEKDEGWTNVYELMEAVVGQPPPYLPSDQFSPEFCSFISACVHKDPKARLSALELMAHPFMNLYEDLHVDLSSYFKNVGSPLASF